MRFHVSNSTFEKALKIIDKGISTGSVIPLYTAVYIKAVDGMLLLQATDKTVYVKHMCEARVEEEGEIAISYSLLHKAISSLGDGVITFELTDSNRATMTCENTRYSFIVLGGEAIVELADFPEFEIEKAVELPCSLLKNMVQKVYGAASSDITRPILAGINLTIENNMLRLCATDAARVALCDTNVETASIEDQFNTIVPSSIFRDVLNLVGDYPSVSVGVTDTQLVIMFGNTVFITRKIEGNYPNCINIFPREASTVVTLKPKELIHAINRVVVMAKDKNHIRLDIDADGQLMKTTINSDSLGDASDYIDVKIEGKSLSITANYKYILECLKNMDKMEEVTLELTETLRPLVFKAYSNVNYLYLIMPVKP